MLLYDIYYRGASCDMQTPLASAGSGAMLAQCRNGARTWLVMRSDGWHPIAEESARKMLATDRARTKGAS